MILSKRQEEILIAVAKGITNEEMAASFQIAQRTVEGHRASVYKKLGLKNTADAVKYCIAYKLIPMPRKQNFNG